MSIDPRPSTPKRQRRSGRIWVVAVAIGMALMLAFAIVNLVDEQAATSPQILFSMLVTTFPLMMVVVVGVALVFGKKR
jgi:magnesium-transporting ATPase (P-type)